MFRPGGVSYLEIPAPEPAALAGFYAGVFGWRVREHAESPAFEDSTGHVIGHFVRALPVAGHAGVRPYVYVERVDDALDAITAAGGAIETAPYPEGDLCVARFRDPAGNVLGVWQRAG